MRYIRVDVARAQWDTCAVVQEGEKQGIQYRYKALAATGDATSSCMQTEQ